MKNPSINLSRGAAIGLGLTVALVGAALWWSYQQSVAAAKAARGLRSAQTQWRALAASEPAPVASVAAELERRVEGAGDVVAELRRQLGGGRRDPVADAALPEGRAEAYFALAQFMERQREAARDAEVQLADRPTFGFSAHRNSGPADGHLVFVHHQMLVAERLLDALWAVEPEQLLAVQREDPVGRLDADGSLRRGREGDPAEWLAWPESRSLRRSGLVDTLALRIGWVGRTASLRAWLARLRELGVPLVVREVVVEPVGEGRVASSRRSLSDLFQDDESEVVVGESAGTGPVPLIANNTAVFWVTIEYLDLSGRAWVVAESEIDEEVLP